MANPVKTILIVDDNVEDRHTYIRYLTEESIYTYRIVESETAEAGWELFQSEDLDLILLDYRLPTINGLEFIAKLKASDRLPPVIMLTRGGSETVAIQAMKAGVKDYLLKNEINAEGLRFVVRSILEQARLQQLAERNENRFRVSVDNMLDCFGIYTSDRNSDGQIISFRTDYLNEAAYQNNLFVVQESTQQDVCSSTISKPEGELFDLCCQVVETGVAISQEYIPTVEHQSAETAIFEVRINKLEDGFVAVWRDITKRKQTEKALKQSEEKFRVLVTQAPMGIFQTDCWGDCNYANPRWLEISGLSLAEAKGKGWSKAVHPDDREKIYHEWYRTARNGKEFDLEYRFKSPQGKVTWVSGRAVAIYKDSGEPDGYFGTIVDITERKQAEALLRSQREQTIAVNQNLQQTTELLTKRNRELDEFTFIVSHDLKAPLRAISNLSSWIEEDLADKLDYETKNNFELLRNRVGRMRMFIESLLHYSRVGKEQTPTETVVVKDLLLDIVDSLAIPPTLEVSIADLPTLNVQKIALQQVFTNLISNAVKHHHTKVGKIAIAATEDRNFWYFSVTDDGPGIAVEHYQRIFEIFQTLSSKKIESAGIGLSIVKKIVEGRGGTVELDSQVGKGTTFSFSWRKPQVV